jgi:hypothetical protein
MSLAILAGRLRSANVHVHRSREATFVVVFATIGTVVLVVILAVLS